MKNEIFWKNPGYQARPALKGDIECDYLIVGGGVTGVSAAYFLAKAGAKNIVLVDKHHIGSGATGKAAGTLVTRGEIDLTQMIDQYGKKKALSIWQGIHKTLREIKKVIDEEKIDCDAELQDTLMCGSKGKNWNYLHREYRAEKSVEGTTKLLEGKELMKELNTELYTRGILSSFHGLSLNPLKFVQNLSVATERYGVKIYEQTGVLKVSGNIAKTSDGSIKFKKIISAIDADNTNDRVKNQKTTIAVTRPLTLPELSQTGLKRRKIVFNSNKNYNYLKVLKDGRILLGYGILLVHKKHRKTEPHVAHLRNIESFIKGLFPYLNLELEYAWAGNFGVTKNYEPVIEFRKNTVSISGAGSQVVCFMSAKQVVKKLLGKPIR